MHQSPRPTHGLGAQVGLFFLYVFLWVAAGVWTTYQFDVTGTGMLLSFLGIGVGLGVVFLPRFRRVYLDRAPPGESLVRSFRPDPGAWSRCGKRNNRNKRLYPPRRYPGA